MLRTPLNEQMALLFDFDGTLVDTVPLWREGLQAVVSAHGASITDQALSEALDASSSAVARTLQLAIGDHIRASQLLDELCERVHVRLKVSIPWMPGAQRLLAEAQAAGVPCALVSSSPLAMLETAISSLPPESFRSVVGAEDVHRPKPSPDAYTLACERLGVGPADSIAIEDSRTGAGAAAAAGVRVVHVGSNALSDVPVAAEFPTLDSIALSDLLRIHGMNRHFRPAR